MLTLALTLLPGAAAADGAADTADAPLRWDEDHPRFRAVEYVATGVVGIAAMAMYVWVPPQAQPHWTGGILFDDSVRDALRLRSPQDLQVAWRAADVVGVTGVVLTVGVDSLLVPTLRGSTDVAWQVGWIDLEAYSFGSIVTFSLYDSIGRTRPSYADCQRNPSLAYDCNISPTASFPSGHVAEAFMSAGLSCANHAYVPLYGSRLGDALACAGGVTLATADGVLRIMGDRHWATDVIAGGAIGFAAGYGLPVLLHYGGAVRRRATIAFAPMVGDRMGLVATGAF